MLQGIVTGLVKEVREGNLDDKGTEYTIWLETRQYNPVTSAHTEQVMIKCPGRMESQVKRMAEVGKRIGVSFQDVAPFAPQAAKKGEMYLAFFAESLFWL